jgi:hypothetical protein
MPGRAARRESGSRLRCVRGLAPALVVGALFAPVAAVPGCGFESAPVTGESRVAPSPVAGASAPGGGLPAGSDPTPVGGGVAPGAGGSAVPAAGSGGRSGSAGAGGPQPDAAVDDPLPSVPSEPGALFSGCVLDLGCDEDLTCYGDRMGYCTERCEADDDCTDHGGVDFTCSDQQCRVDCGAAGTDGECPAPLVCTPQLFLGERCLLPRE